jgi:uncharacterized membrane protein
MGAPPDLGCLVGLVLLFVPLGLWKLIELIITLIRLWS